MNWDTVQGSWKQFKGKAKQRWGKLTDDDLDVIAGKRDELEGRLQKAYGYTKEKAQQEIDTFCKSCKDSELSA
ncbi:MAG: CsbD family protein [Planctomycetes bacterium]|nr:CsbD family protein [Planctomycetota bacterium]